MLPHRRLCLHLKNFPSPALATMDDKEDRIELLCPWGRFSNKIWNQSYD